METWTIASLPFWILAVACALKAVLGMGMGLATGKMQKDDFPTFELLAAGIFAYIAARVMGA